jgi:hypothetical protein
VKRDPNLVHTARHAKEVAFAGKLKIYTFSCIFFIALFNKKFNVFYVSYLVECKGSDQGEVVTW